MHTIVLKMVSDVEESVDRYQPLTLSSTKKEGASAPSMEEGVRHPLPPILLQFSYGSFHRTH